MVSKSAKKHNATHAKVMNWAVHVSKLSKEDFQIYINEIYEDPNEKERFKGFATSKFVQRFNDIFPMNNLPMESRPSTPGESEPESDRSRSDSEQLTPKNKEPAVEHLAKEKVELAKEKEQLAKKNEQLVKEIEQLKETTSKVPQKRKKFDPADHTAIIKLLTTNADTQKFDIPSTVVVVPATKTELYTSIKNHLAKIFNSVYDTNQARYAIADNLMKLSELHHGKLKDDGTTTTSKKFLDLIEEKFKISSR